MPTEKKIQQIELIKTKLSECTIAISTDYRGLSVNDMTSLRRTLRDQGVEYRVVKVSLTYRAADEVSMPELKEIVQESTGIAFGYGDPVQVAKALDEFIRSNKVSLNIRGAILDHKVLTADRVMALATLPPKDVLIAQLMGQMKSPISGLVIALNGVVTGLVTVLQRHVEQEEAKAS
jgi:large subunit ribosomal protein L10